MQADKPSKKISIKISKIGQPTRKGGVSVVTKETGKLLWLPIKYTEHYGDTIWIPTWLAYKIGIKNGQ